MGWRRNFLVLIGFVFLISVVVAIGSTNYNIDGAVVGSGGGNIYSTNYDTDVVIGIISGETLSSNYGIELGSFFGIAAEGDTEISGCTNITSPGTYLLTADITDSSISYCMNISANDVTLDCQGHTIDGDDSAGYGIYAYRESATNANIAIQNCVVNDWASAGMYLDYVGNTTVTNSVFNSSYDGIHLRDIDDAVLNNVTLTNNLEGIDLYYLVGVVINNSKIYDNLYYNLRLRQIASCAALVVENVTDDNDIPLVYYNIASNISNWDNNFSEILLCNADGSNIINITGVGDGNGNLISSYYTNNVLFKGLELNNSYNGLFINSNDGSDLVTINDSSFNNNSLSGIDLNYQTNISISNITARDNGRAIDIYRATDVVIKNSRLIDSDSYGIHVRHEEDTGDLLEVSNNFFNNTDNVYLYAGDAYYYSWNTTNQTGDRIYLSGTNIGGNFYANPLGTGFSETCSDADYDGFCDLAFNLTTETACTIGVNCSVNNTDYLPLSSGDIIAPQISFVEPTPNNSETVTEDYVYVNVTSSDFSNHSAFLDWNRSLVGWWNFESYNSTGVFDNSTYDNFGTFYNSSSSNIRTGVRGDAFEFGSNESFI
ncbi:right-handed parallel beta-helix repeat-containing protein, partial [Candidatus Pacearchaeota archaeon]|nr:right-handed parallel beta-helix repeat-containing protein [Candidatus Pacearchaeota archaeon]